MNIVSLKYDEVFRELFRRESIRKQFLSDVLGIPLEKIKSTRIVNSYLWKRYHKQKQGILDVAMELNDNTRIDVELQIHRQADWIKRELFYLAKMYTEDLRVGEDYSKLCHCVSIGILDFNLVDGKEYHTVYRLRDREGKDLTDLWEIHIIELRKPLNDNKGIEDWIRLFNAKSREDLDMIKTTKAGLAEAIEVMKEMSLGKSLRYLYEAHMKEVRDRRAMEQYVRETVWEEAEAAGNAVGRMRGKAEGKAEGVLQLLEELGPVPIQLQERIMAEKNEDTLKRWLKTAARAESVEEFRDKEKLENIKKSVTEP